MLCMLTYWQAWRRSVANYSPTKAQHNEEYYRHCLAVTADNWGVGSIILADPNPPIVHLESSCADTGSIKSRRLKFDDTVRVYLIPCRSEFSAAFRDLFWQREDYVDFKDDAYHELQTYWKDNNSTVKEAIVALYQPIYSEQADDHHGVRREFKVGFVQKTIMVHNDSVADLAHLVRSAGASHHPSSAVKAATQALYQPEHVSTDREAEEGLQEGRGGGGGRFSHTVMLSHVDSVGNLCDIVHSHAAPASSSNDHTLAGNTRPEGVAIGVGDKLWVHNDSVFNFSDYRCCLDGESLASTIATDDDSSCGGDVGMDIIILSSSD